MTAFIGSIVTAPRTLTEQERTQLLRATAERWDDFRDHVLYQTALGTGLREHELVALNVGDVFVPEGKAKRRVALRVFKRSRQKPAHQDVLLSEDLQAKLERFLAWKAWAHEDMGPNAPLFVSLRGTRLSTRQVRHSFAVWQRRAGFDRRLAFHALRHSACSALYRGTKDIRLTQRFARHTSVLTTAIYTHPTDEDLLRAIDGLPA